MLADIRIKSVSYLVGHFSVNFDATTTDVSVIYGVHWSTP